MTVLAVHNWTSNAELICDLVELGYLKGRWLTLDPTYGRGVWWNIWRPKQLVTHDISIDGVDFRNLPEDDGTFDASVFDPPYISTGGRKTSTLADFNNRYGLVDAPRTPALMQAYNNEGLREVARVTKKRERGKDNGLILVKSCDYVSSGHVFPGTYETEKFAVEELGLRRIDRFDHIGTPRPQPARTRKCKACDGNPQGCPSCTEGRVLSEQQHARRNSSTMFVFQKVA